MTENVFAPPRATVDVRTGPGELWDLSWKDLRKLYYASVNIRTIGVLNVIGSLLLIAVLAIPFFTGSASAQPGSLVPVVAFIFVATALSLLVAWTAFARPGWGRWFGIVMLVIGLINFPIGTLISIWGLVAYIQGRRLFGADRLTHKEVADVYKLRKVDKK